MNRVAVLLAEGFEEVEAITPVDFLRRAGLHVDVLGVSGARVTGSHGITMSVDMPISSYRTVPDGVILPGGMPGAQNLADSSGVITLLRVVAESGGLIAAICAAPAVVLSPNGLLGGYRATCFPGFENRLADDVEFSEERVVVDRDRITSRGPGTAAEFSGAIIRSLLGAEAEAEVLSSTLQG